MRDLRLDFLCWVFCFVVLGGLLFGLDRYRRLPLQHGYGPYLREFFTATLERAHRLDVNGSVRISPQERWQLVGNWKTPDETEASRVLAGQRRAVIVLPVLTPSSLEVKMDLSPLPDGTRGEEPIEVEYGINGLAAGRLSIPPEGATLVATLPAGSLHRGDNAFYLYRLSRRADPSPWLSVGEIEVRRASGSGP